MFPASVFRYFVLYALFAAREGAHIRAVVSELDLLRSGPSTLRIDNKSTIDMAHDPVAFKKTKHLPLPGGGVPGSSSSTMDLQADAHVAHVLSSAPPVIGAPLRLSKAAAQHRAARHPPFYAGMPCGTCGGLISAVHPGTTSGGQVVHDTLSCLEPRAGVRFYALLMHVTHPAAGVM